VGAEISFQLPSDAPATFETLLGALDSNLDSLGVATYGLSVTTLEEVGEYLLERFLLLSAAYPASNFKRFTYGLLLFEARLQKWFRSFYGPPQGQI
jgi:hypothetical protein